MKKELMDINHKILRINSLSVDFEQYLSELIQQLNLFKENCLKFLEPVKTATELAKPLVDLLNSNDRIELNSILQNLFTADLRYKGSSEFISKTIDLITPLIQENKYDQVINSLSQLRFEIYFPGSYTPFQTSLRKLNRILKGKKVSNSLLLIL